MDNLQNEKKKIHEYQAKLDELDDDGQNNFDNVLADEEDDPGIDDDHENQNKQKQHEMKKQKERQLYDQLLSGVQKSVDRLVNNEIDAICQKVLMSHIDTLDKMNYIVIFANKKAIFRLKGQNDTFKTIKITIA